MSFSHGPHARWVGNSLAEFERDLADNLCYERGTTAVSASAVQPLIDSLLRRDEYMVLADYRPYIHCQDQSVEPAWADQDRWTQMSILNTTRSGFFSSDRTVRGYCRDIWHAKPVPVAADTAAAQEPLIPGS